MREEEIKRVRERVIERMTEEEIKREGERERWGGKTDPASSTWNQSLFNPNGRQQNRNSHVRSGFRDRSVDPGHPRCHGFKCPVNTRTREN